MAVTNKKLQDRSLRILMDLTEIDRAAAEILLEKSGKSVKLALLMQWTGLDAVSGQDLLNQHQGQLRQAVLSWNLP